MTDTTTTEAPNGLRDWLHKNGWSLAEAAGLTGFSPSMLCLIQNGKRQPSPQAKVAIARGLGAQVADLFPVPAIDERHVA